MGESQVRVGADMSTFDRDVTTGIKRTAGGLSGIGSTIATGLAIGATAVAGLGAAAFANSERVGKMADSLFDLSAVTGASTDQLQEWRFVAEKTGQKTDFFGDSVKQLNRTMTQIEDGTGKASDALSRLGVSVRNTDGSMKSAAQITNDAIVALSGMSDVSLRAQLATDIFSRKANELIPILDEGAAGLEAMKIQAHELGGVLSEEDLIAADHFRASLAVLHTQISGVGNAVGANLAPVLDSMVQLVSNRILPAIINASDAFGTWWTTMQDGPGVIANIKDALGNIFDGDTITKVMGGIQEAMQSGIEGAAKWIRSGGLTGLVESFLSGKAAFLQSGLDLVVALIGGIAEALPTVLDFIVGDLIPDLVNSIVTAIPLILDAAVQLFSSLLTAATTVLPELIGTLLGTVLPQLGKSLVAMYPALVDSALGLFSSLVDALVTIIPDLVETLTGEVIPNLMDAMLDSWPKIMDSALTLVLGLVDGIVKGLPLLIGAIGKAVPMLLQAILTAAPQLLKGGIALVLGLLNGIVAALPSIITAVIDAIPLITAALIEAGPSIATGGIQLVIALVGGIVEALPSIVEAIIVAVPAIMLAFRDAWPQLIDAGKQILVQMWNGVQAQWPVVRDWFASLPGAILDFWKDAGSWWMDVGKDVMHGLWNGMKSIWGDITAWVSDQAKKLPKWMKDALGIKSPSTVFAGIGENVMLGFQKGLLGGLPNVQAAFAQIPTNVTVSPPSGIPSMGGTSTGGAGGGFMIGSVSIEVNVSGVASDYDAERAGRMAAQAALKELSAKARLR